MQQSFTIGRRIAYNENTDKRLTKEIENEISGLWVRRPKVDKNGKKVKGDASHGKFSIIFLDKTNLIIILDPNTKVNSHQQAQQVFCSLDFTQRTDEFYK